MRGAFYQDGSRDALGQIGLAKRAAAPEMGGGDFTPYASATGDSGRTFGRTNESTASGAQTAFSENDRHVLRDPANEAHPFPIGAQQSLGVKAAEAYRKMRESSPIKIRNHKLVKHVGPFYASETAQEWAPELKRGKGDAYIGHNEDWPDAALAHELGHHEVEQGTLTKYLQHPVARYMNAFAPLATYAAGSLTPEGYKLPATALTATLMHGPTLASEGLADYHGYKKLQEHGADSEMLKDYVKTLAPYQASYLIGPLMSALSGASGAYHSKKMSAYSKLAARKLEDRLKFRGLDISVETDAGSVREWHDPHSGESGKTTMKYPYGYIRKTKGADGDHVDVYVGPDEAAPNVYVVHQMKKPDFKTYDEDKVMLGFASEDAAREAYLAHYNDPRFLGSVKEMSFDDFKDTVLDKRNHGGKLASNMYQADFDRPMGSGPGPTHNQVPGDFLGLPQSQMGGYRRIVGGRPETPTDNIDRMFRFHDEPMDTRVLEGGANVPDGAPL